MCSFILLLCLGRMAHNGFSYECYTFVAYMNKDLDGNDGSITKPSNQTDRQTLAQPPKATLSRIKGAVVRLKMKD